MSQSGSGYRRVPRNRPRSTSSHEENIVPDSAPDSETTKWMILGSVVTGVLVLGCVIATLVLVAIDYSDTKDIKNAIIVNDDGSPVDFSTSDCEYCSHEETEHALKYMQQRENDIEHDAKHHSPISWSTYKSDENKYSGRVVELYQTDFDSGTLRIHTPGMFVFKEDVFFNPNPAYDHMPTMSQSEYADPAYRMGFFAGITVESDDVLIDLDDHTFGQSEAHALQQRFFFLIELNDQPFLTAEGPMNFGNDVTFVKNVIVRNGVLGPTAHHGIHGNGGKKIFVHDVDIVEKEVAGIALNGFTDVVLQRVTVSGMRSVAVLGTYAQSRGVGQFADLALALSAGSNPTEEANLQSALTTLRTLMGEVYSDMITDGLGYINCTAHPDACDLFDNPTRLPDGGITYGILFNSLGVSVLGFGEGTPQEGGDVKFGGDIYMLDCDIKKQAGSPNEIIALVNVTSGKIQHGPTGGIIRALEWATGVNGDYSGTAQSEVQILLAKLVRKLPANKQVYFSRMVIDDGVIDWYDGVRSLTDLITSGDFRFMQNGDAQAHVLKGSIGIRIERSNGVCLNGINVDGIINTAERCQEGPFYGQTEPDFCPQASGNGHPAQGHYSCCQRSDARGISVVESSGVRMRDVDISNVTSIHAWARGIDIFHKAKRVSVIDTDISEIYAAPGCSYEESCCSDKWGSPKPPQAIGLAFELVDVADVCRENVKITDVENGCVLSAFQTAGGEL